MSHLILRIPRMMRLAAGDRFEKLSTMSLMSVSLISQKSVNLSKTPFVYDCVAMLNITETNPFKALVDVGKRRSSGHSYCSCSSLLRVRLISHMDFSLISSVLVHRRADIVIGDQPINLESRRKSNSLILHHK